MMPGGGGKRGVRPRRLAALLAATLAAAGGAYWHYVRGAPYRVLGRFVRALEERDARTIAALALPEEAEGTGLSERAVALLLPELYGGPWQRVQRDDAIGDAPFWERDPAAADLDAPPRLRQNFVYWADAATGRPLPGVARYTSRPQLSSTIIVRRTRAGWRVNAGYSLWSTALSKWGRGTYPVSYAEALERAGLSGYVGDDGVLHTADEVRARAPDPARDGPPAVSSAAATTAPVCIKNGADTVPNPFCRACGASKVDGFSVGRKIGISPFTDWAQYPCVRRDGATFCLERLRSRAASKRGRCG